MTNANETSASLFAWMPFYSELATKLLAFKNNRKTLLSRERQKFCVHGIIGARQTGASNEHEHQTQFS